MRGRFGNLNGRRGNVLRLERRLGFRRQRYRFACNDRHLHRYGNNRRRLYEYGHGYGNGGGYFKRNGDGLPLGNLFGFWNYAGSKRSGFLCLVAGRRNRIND